MGLAQGQAGAVLSDLAGAGAPRRMLTDTAPNTVVFDISPATAILISVFVLIWDFFLVRTLRTRMLGSRSHLTRNSQGVLHRIPARLLHLAERHGCLMLLSFAYRCMQQRCRRLSHQRLVQVGVFTSFGGTAARAPPRSATRSAPLAIDASARPGVTPGVVAGRPPVRGASIDSTGRGLAAGVDAATRL
jgi:hypothetical protein